MLRIGEWKLESHLLLAPMAGITDLPFRKICKEYGAGLAISEMLTSDIELWGTPKSRTRLPQPDEAEPRSTQIAGTDPELMAKAARFSVEKGAQIIDINMGCPAKKVCNKAAGSALLQEPETVKQILKAVKSSVSTPVTLKIRTGWSRQNRNALEIARIAEDQGISALTIHGRTRADAYRGCAEFETVRRVKSLVSMPVIVNGDIRLANDIDFAIDYCGADGIMIGRAAQGAPWIFREYLDRSTPRSTAPDFHDKTRTIKQHIQHIHHYFGDQTGVRIARKHINWYLGTLKLSATPLRQELLTTRIPSRQIDLLEEIFAIPPNNEKV